MSDPTPDRIPTLTELTESDMRKALIRAWRERDEARLQRDRAVSFLVSNHGGLKQHGDATLPAPLRRNDD